MITVGKLAEMFELSRTTLLYYDRIGLLQPTTRSGAGYRFYGRDGVERLRTICSYRDAGLTLEEIKLLLTKPDDPSERILRNRLMQLDDEIGKLRIQQRAIIGILRSIGATESISSIDKNAWVKILRSCGLSEEDMGRWHSQFEHDAPAAHHAFLRWLGIPEEEALEIRARSKRRRTKR